MTVQPVNLVPLPLRWRALSILGLSEAETLRVTAKLSGVLDSWLGTRYMAGNAAKGVDGGVDCVRFVCSVLDELYGYPREKLDRLPHDVAMHNAARARSALKQMLSIYEPNERVFDLSLEPGDIVVVSASADAGPSHAKIAGVKRNTLYHATSDGVTMTGILEPAGTPWAVYRLSDRHKWVT